MIGVDLDANQFSKQDPPYFQWLLLCYGIAVCVKQEGDIHNQYWILYIEFLIHGNSVCCETTTKTALVAWMASHTWCLVIVLGQEVSVCKHQCPASTSHQEPIGGYFTRGLVGHNSYSSFLWSSQKGKKNLFYTCISYCTKSFLHYYYYCWVLCWFIICFS